jgi:hypothetical protein
LGVVVVLVMMFLCSCLTPSMVCEHLEQNSISSESCSKICQGEILGYGQSCQRNKNFGDNRNEICYNRNEILCGVNEFLW